MLTHNLRRLLKTLCVLDGRTTEHICDLTGTPRKTFYRDLATLRALGVVVESATPGRYADTWVVKESKVININELKRLYL